VEFLGRTDQQVKIRGFRIELEEIESILTKHTSVAQTAISTYTTPSGKELVACVRMHRGSSFDVTSLREHIGMHLPNYMLPATIIEIDEFPLTPNGKIDRNKLPLPQFDSIVSTFRDEPPRDSNLGKVPW
jgi:acyl-coenzyme A synthetase/AMP-(fatty) acid ligase